MDYCSSKFAALGIDDTLKVELAALGHDEYIKTTVVCPYYISTGMFAGVKSKVLYLICQDALPNKVKSGPHASYELTRKTLQCNVLL